MLLNELKHLNQEYSVIRFGCTNYSSAGHSSIPYKLLLIHVRLCSHPSGNSRIIMLILSQAELDLLDICMTLQESKAHIDHELVSQERCPPSLSHLPENIERVI